MKVDINIIVCTYNRFKTLAATLDSLSGQKGVENLKYEVIVVDNNSTDETRQVIMQWVKKDSDRFRYVLEACQGLNHARNAGLQEARGELIVYTDDDVLLSDNWIANIWECYQKVHFDAMGGKVLPQYPPDTPQWVKQNRDILQGPIVCHDCGEETKLYNENMPSFIGASMVFQRNIFDEIGVFDPNLGAGKGTLGDDTDFFYRLKKGNKKIFYCGKVVSWHPVEVSRMSLKYIAKWHISAGRYLVRNESPEELKKMTYFFGVPRYLLKQTFRQGCQLLLNIFNKEKFLRSWNYFFLDIGRMKEYRSQTQCRKSV